MAEIGFTGSQNGMNKLQKLLLQEHLEYLVQKYNVSKFHHGDCIGADETFHNVVREQIKDCWIKIHPPVNESRRAWCVGDEYAEAKEYLVRNTDIVLESDILFATPNTVEEQLRSGTWSTWRKGKNKPGMKVVLLRPDGTFKIEECKQPSQSSLFR